MGGSISNVGGALVHIYIYTYIVREREREEREMLEIR